MQQTNAAFGKWPAISGKQGHLQAVCKEQVRAPSNADKHTVKQLEPATEQEEDMTI